MFTAISGQSYFNTFASACPVPFIPTVCRQPAIVLPCLSSAAAAPLSYCNTGLSASMMSIPYFGSMLYSTNIFIQNMYNFIARNAARIKQQQAITSAYKLPSYSKYRFGALTTPVRNNYTYTSITSTRAAAKNSSFWERLGYKASSGLRLARTAMSRARGFVGRCAKYVKNAIASCGLGRYVNGNACEMTRILRNNKNFREISPAGVDLKSLPAGCILVYGRGVSGYSSRYGHTEITTGSGKAVSDGITNNIRGNVTAIFIPVA